MIKINVVTPAGQLLEEEIEMIIVRNEEGEQAILQDHVPSVIAIDPGYIRLKRNDEQLYVTVVGGFLEFSNNIVNVIAQEAEIGRNPESALKHLAYLRNERMEENRRRSVDFAKAERDLKRLIQEIGAGNVS